MFARSFLSSRLGNGKQFLILPLKSHLPRSFSNQFHTFSTKTSKFQPINNIQLLHYLSTSKPKITLNFRRSYSTEQPNEPKRELTPKIGSFFDHQVFDETEKNDLRKIAQEFEEYYYKKKSIGFPYATRRIPFTWFLSALVLLVGLSFAFTRDTQLDDATEATDKMRQQCEILEQIVEKMAENGEIDKDYKETTYGLGNIVVREHLALAPQEDRFKYFQTAFNVMSSFGMAFFYSTLVAKWQIKRYLKKFPGAIPVFTENVKNFIILRRSTICSASVLGMTSVVVLVSSFFDSGASTPDYPLSTMSVDDYIHALPKTDFPKHFDNLAGAISFNYYLNPRLLLPLEDEKKMDGIMRKRNDYLKVQTITEFLMFLLTTRYAMNVFFPYYFSKEISRLVAASEKNFHLLMESRYYLLPGDIKVHSVLNVKSEILPDISLFTYKSDYEILATTREADFELPDNEEDAEENRLTQEAIQEAFVSFQNQRREYDDDEDEEL